MRPVLSLVIIVFVASCSGDIQPDGLDAVSLAADAFFVGQGTDRVHDAAGPAVLSGLDSAGVECLNNDDCDGGICIVTDSGGICGLECNGPNCQEICELQCPSGMMCVRSGSDEAWLCAPAHGALCRPCDTDSDCVEVTGLSRCLGYANNQHFCGAVCGNELPCPQAYTCQSQRPDRLQNPRKIAVFRLSSTIHPQFIVRR